MRLGIDFGTCYSSAALFLDSRVRAIKDPINLGYSFPSSVFLTSQGEVLVGQAAENKRQLKPEYYQREFKRDLGSDFPYFLGSSKKMPEDLVTEVIKKLKTEADKVAQGLGEPLLTQAILTIPATYEPNKRQLMRETCQRAGFKDIKLLEEPVAAGIYYSQVAKVPEDAIILVYDFGGGTFDATLLKKQNSHYQLLGMPVGLPNCGGADFDRLIFQELLHNCSPGLQQKLKDPNNFRNRIVPECLKLKHQLSEASEGEIWIPIAETESFSLSRERFNEMIDGLVSETLECCDRLLTNTHLEWSQIDRVLLVGGSCRIPYVRELVAQKWGKTPIQVDEPELAVCYGAAIYGAEPESPESYLQKGLEKIQVGEYQDAIAEFNQAIRLDSHYAPAYCHRGLAHAHLEENQAAFEDYDLAIRLDRNYGEAYLHRGDLRCQANDFKGAIEDYDHALFVNPDLTEGAEKKEDIVHQLISIAHPQTDEPVQPIQQTTQNNSASELEAQKYFTQAQEFFEKGDYPKSIAMLRESITLKPDSAGVHALLGCVLFQQEQFDEAKAELEIANRLDPNNSNIHYLLGAILQEQGLAEEAVSEYTKAIKIDPNHADAHFELGNIWANKGKGYVSLAIFKYQKAIKIAPDNADYHNKLGCSLLKKGDIEAAISEYKIAINLDPNLDIARDNLEAAEAQLQPETATYNPELPSEWGADYTKLRDLLAAGNWKEADLETKAIFQQFGGLFDPFHSQGAIGTMLGTAVIVSPIAAPIVLAGFFAYAKNKIQNIPQTDLSTIDRLWVEYSNGHFGFSIQEQIFTQVGKKEGDFGEFVQWREKAGIWGGTFAWKNHSQLTFSLNAPQGHLPSLPWWSKDGLGGLSDVFYSRVKSCQLNSQDHGKLDSDNAEAEAEIANIANTDVVDIEPKQEEKKATNELEDLGLDLTKHWRCIKTLEGHSGFFAGVLSVAFSPDGKMLASGSHDATIKLWRVGTGQEIRTIRVNTGAIESVAFSPDGSILASASSNAHEFDSSKNTIKLWQTSNGIEIRTLQTLENDFRSVVFSPDGQILACASTYSIRLWQVSTGKKIRILMGSNKVFLSIAFSPNGKFLAGVSGDRTIRLWQVNTGEEIRLIKDCGIFVTFSPDGQTLATCKTNGIKLLQVDSGQEIAFLKDESLFFYCAAFSPDGQILAGGSFDNKVVLWQVSTGQKICTLTGHTNQVKSVVFSPDGTLLASGSDDKTIKLWQRE